MSEYNQHIRSIEGSSLLAMSGGPDSVALFHMLQAEDKEFEVAHFEHGVRGEESVEDMDWVVQLCKRHGVACHVERAEGLHTAKGNFHELARNARYDWMSGLCRERGLDAILTAHHLDDAREGFILASMRGAGMARLSMGESAWAGVPILRPLMGMSKDALLDYLDENGFDYRIDRSNEDVSYDRNYVRHEIMPRLKERFHGLEGLDRTMENLSSHWEDLSRYYHQLVTSRLVGSTQKGSINVEGEEPGILTRALLHVLGLPLSHADELIALVGSEKGRWVQVQQYRFTREGQELRFTSSTQETLECEIPGEGVTRLGHLEVIVAKSAMPACFIKEENAIWLPLDVAFPLTLRSWRQGDRMRPFGMDGTKLVSDILIDAKVNVFDKEKVLVLEDSSGELLWVVGLRNSEGCRLEDAEKEAYRIQISQV